MVAQEARAAREPKVAQARVVQAALPAVEQQTQQEQQAIMVVEVMAGQAGLGQDLPVEQEDPPLITRAQYMVVAVQEVETQQVAEVPKA